MNGYDTAQSALKKTVGSSQRHIGIVFTKFQDAWCARNMEGFWLKQMLRFGIEAIDTHTSLLKMSFRGTFGKV
jgi:hypothetical protein